MSQYSDLAVGLSDRLEGIKDFNADLQRVKEPTHKPFAHTILTQDTLEVQSFVNIDYEAYAKTMKANDIRLPSQTLQSRSFAEMQHGESSEYVDIEVVSLHDKPQLDIRDSFSNSRIASNIGEDLETTFVHRQQLTSEKKPKPSKQTPVASMTAEKQPSLLSYKNRVQLHQMDPP